MSGIAIQLVIVIITAMSLRNLHPLGLTQRRRLGLATQRHHKRRIRRRRIRRRPRRRRLLLPGGQASRQGRERREETGRAARARR